MEPALVVRPAGPADAAAVADVLARAFAAYQPRYTPRAYEATTPRPAGVLGRMAEGPVWLASLGEPVGTAGAVARGDAWYVRGMGVVPEARGRGVARALLAALESEARAAGAARLTLSTTPFLAEAISLYEREGFRFDGTTGDLHGTPLRGMAKPLDAAP